MYLENRIQNLKLLKDRDIQKRGKKQLRCFSKNVNVLPAKRQVVVIKVKQCNKMNFVNTLKEPRPKRPTLRT